MTTQTPMRNNILTDCVEKKSIVVSVPLAHLCMLNLRIKRLAFIETAPYEMNNLRCQLHVYDVQKLFALQTGQSGFK